MGKSMDKKNEKKKLLNRILLCVFIAGLFISLGLMVRNWYIKKNAENILADMTRQTTETSNSTEDAWLTDTEVEKESETETTDILTELGIEVPEKTIDFAALQEENPDIYAWIYVPGTKVDYPVLQHPEDDSYYLNHNLDGSSGYPGCIYSEKVNNKEFSDPQTVLYGHNMKDGTGFGSLHNFEDKAVFDEYPYIYIYMRDKTLVYRIFGAYEYNAIHLIYNFDLSNPEIFQNYLDQIFTIRDMKANIRQETTLTSDNHILTLSTCVTGEKNKRFLVQGVLLNEEDLVTIK